MLGESVQEKIINEVNDAKMIGLIEDTTPDITHMDQLTVGVRFVDAKDKPKERLLAITEICDKTGKGFAEAVLKSLSENNVNTEYVRFQTYDSTASISGQYQGAQTLLSQMLERHVICIPCLPHGSNIMIDHGCNASCT